MRIVVDENMPFGREAFESVGDVTAMPGRDITAAHLRDVDMLMVRSVTKVNAELLEGTKVRFVGTATIGEDHIDKDYLAARRIAFSSAPGCNANSVGQYVTAVLLELAHRFGLSLRDMKMGVIGVGNVGSRVMRKGAALGLRCVPNDPPVREATGDARYRPLEEALACDIVTLHVPLTDGGPHPTHHMVDESFIGRMKHGAILMNTSRGPVAPNDALHKGLDTGRLAACVLDVWEGEPRIDTTLLDRAFIGTPHIAGYSFDGKVNGTRQIYQAACVFLGIAPTWNPVPLLPEPECPQVRVAGNDKDPQETFRRAVRQVYDIMRDDRATRALGSLPAAEVPAAFDRLRKQYPRRREFFNTRAIVSPRDTALEDMLAGIGFSVAKPE